MQTFIDLSQSQVNRIHYLAERLNTSNNQLFGHVPEKAVANSDVPAPAGMCQHLEYTQNDLGNAIDRLEREIYRLESGFHFGETSVGLPSSGGYVGGKY